MASRRSHHPLAVTLTALFLALSGSSCDQGLLESTGSTMETRQERILSGTIGDYIVLVGNTVYMRNASTGDIHVYLPGTNQWQRVGGNGRQFVGSGSALYALTPEGTVAQYKDNQWRTIGDSGETLYAGGAGLLATNPLSHDVWHFSETTNGWDRVGGPGASFAVGGSQFFGITPEYDKLFLNTGVAPFPWTEIGTSTGWVYPGATRMFAAGTPKGGKGSPGLTGELYLFNGSPGAWTWVGGPGKTFAVVGDVLFGMGQDSRVYMNRAGEPGGWRDVGGPVEWIYGGTGKLLCAKIPLGWGGACFDVDTERWTTIGQP